MMHKHIGNIQLVNNFNLYFAVLFLLFFSSCRNQNDEFTHKIVIDGNVPSAVFSAYKSGSLKDRMNADGNGDATLSFIDNKENTVLDSITGKADGYTPIKYTNQTVGSNKSFSFNMVMPSYVHNITMDGNVASAVFSAYKGGVVKDSKTADGNGDAVLSFTDNLENTTLDSITGTAPGHLKYKVVNQSVGASKTIPVTFDKLTFTHTVTMDGNVASADFTAYKGGTVRDSKTANGEGDAVLSFTDDSETTTLDSIIGNANGYVKYKIVNAIVDASKTIPVTFEKKTYTHTVTMDGNVASAVFDFYDSGKKDSKTADANGDAVHSFTDNSETTVIDSIVGNASGYLKYKIVNASVDASKTIPVTFEKAQKSLTWNFSTSENINTINISLFNAKGERIYTGDVSLSGKLDDITSLGNINDASWKMKYVSDLTLTDSVMFNPSTTGSIMKTLGSRPTASLNAVDVFTRKHEYGGLKSLSEMTPVPNLEVMIGNVLYGKTNSQGAFSFRPDLVGNQRILVIDRSEMYYSKWFDVSLTPGGIITVTDFKSGEVDMIKKYVDALGKDLLEAFWHINGFADPGPASRGYVGVGIPDSILLKKVNVDKKFAELGLNNVVSDISESLKNVHFKGVPKFVEGNADESYVRIHHGGTWADGQTRSTYRQTPEGLYYVTGADIYTSVEIASTNTKGEIYSIIVHEWGRVFFAPDATFPEMNYVMFSDPMSRWYKGYDPNFTPLEQMIGDLKMSMSTFPKIHNNFLLSKTLNFPGYNGTKSASIITLDEKNSNYFEKMFPNASNIEFGRDQNGKYMTVTHKHHYPVGAFLPNVP